MDKRIFFMSHPEARRRALQAISEAPEGYRVTVEPPKRSGDQNAALHALVQEIAERCEWAGMKHDVETWKRLLVSAWARATGQRVQVVPSLDGYGVDMVPIRTSKLTKAECSELLEFINAWAAENMCAVEE